MVKILLFYYLKFFRNGVSLFNGSSKILEVRKIVIAGNAANTDERFSFYILNLIG